MCLIQSFISYCFNYYLVNILLCVGMMDGTIGKAHYQGYRTHKLEWLRSIDLLTKMSCKLVRRPHLGEVLSKTLLSIASYFCIGNSVVRRDFSSSFDL